MGRKMTLVQLIAATYFMVAGGPYGLEDLVQMAGYSAAVLVLLITPVLWSLPTALMVSELSSAIPEEGGYYAWVRRAMGPFWGFQEAWLSLAASIFDMAIYPTLFIAYLGRLWPTLGDSHADWAIGVAVIAACAAGNILGARAIGGSSVIMTIAMLGPCTVLTVLALVHRPEAVAEWPQSEKNFDLVVGGMLVAMWNYMGWDNASTIAGEVERPQRAYPLAMIGALFLVVLTYLTPVLAVSQTQVDPATWSTGSWAEMGRIVGGPALRVAVVLGGMISAFGMCNALVLSYTRLPAVLAEDGYLPAVFKRRHSRTNAPWVAILACAGAWALALPLGFKHLVAFDVILYGLSLLLEFVALILLRSREPGLRRPFRVPGGKLIAGFLGLGPAALLGVALYHARGEKIGALDAVHVGALLVALGPMIYLASRWLRRAPSPCPLPRGERAP